MKIETSELEGAALDYAVAAVTGVHDDGEHAAMEIGMGRYSPSTDWSQGGPLIEQYQVGVSAGMNGKWCAVKGMPHYASTPLIAAMRAIVAFELGGEIDVPDDLA